MITAKGSWQHHRRGKDEASAREERVIERLLHVLRHCVHLALHLIYHRKWIEVHRWVHLINARIFLKSTALEHGLLGDLLETSTEAGPPFNYLSLVLGQLKNMNKPAIQNTKRYAYK